MPQYIINNTYHFTLIPYLLDSYVLFCCSPNLKQHFLLLLVLLLLTMPANGVVVPVESKSTLDYFGSQLNVML